MEKELLNKWPEIFVILFITYKAVNFILSKTTKEENRKPCTDLDKFKSEARNKMKTNESANIALNLKYASIVGKLDLVNNELAHVKTEQAIQGQDIKDIRKDLTFVVTELKNGTKFSNK